MFSATSQGVVLLKGDLSGSGHAVLGKASASQPSAQQGVAE